MQRLGVIIAGLLISTAQGFAQGVPPELINYADTIFTNGKIVTVDDRSSVAQAVAVRDGKILAVGQNAQMLCLAGPKTVRIDLKGKTMIPGLIDTHAHLAGERLLDVAVHPAPVKFVACHYAARLMATTLERVTKFAMRANASRICASVGCA